MNWIKDFIPTMKRNLSQTFGGDKDSKIPFKKVLITVGYAHAPGLLRFFAVTPDLVISIIFLTQSGFLLL